jgi:hypothetical protein
VQPAAGVSPGPRIRVAKGVASPQAEWASQLPTSAEAVELAMRGDDGGDGDEDSDGGDGDAHGPLRSPATAVAAAADDFHRIVRPGKSPSLRLLCAFYVLCKTAMPFRLRAWVRLNADIKYSPAFRLIARPCPFDL